MKKKVTAKKLPELPTLGKLKSFLDESSTTKLHCWEVLAHLYNSSLWLTEKKVEEKSRNKKIAPFFIDARVGLDGNRITVKGMYTTKWARHYLVWAFPECEETISSNLPYIRADDPTDDDINMFECLNIVGNIIAHYPQREADVLRFLESKSTVKYVIKKYDPKKKTGSPYLSAETMRILTEMYEKPATISSVANYCDQIMDAILEECEKNGIKPKTPEAKIFKKIQKKGIKYSELNFLISTYFKQGYEAGVQDKLYKLIHKLDFHIREDNGASWVYRIGVLIFLTAILMLQLN